MPQLRTRARTLPSLALIVWLIIQAGPLPVAPDSPLWSEPISSEQPGPHDASATPTDRLASTLLAGSPLGFEQNLGQTDEPVKFFARGSGYTLFLTSTEAVIQLRPPTRLRLASDRGLWIGDCPWSAVRDPLQSTPNNEQRTTDDSTVLRMKLLGATAQPKVTGLEELPGTLNYFTGSDPAEWHSRVATFARVKYEDVYPGVDLIYYGDQRELEYDFVLQPGADPNVISLAFAGADKLEVNASGDLIVSTAAGQLRQRKPFVYQEPGGVKREVPGHYVMSVAFPTANPPQRLLGGGLDAFVAKLNADGTALGYSLSWWTWK